MGKIAFIIILKLTSYFIPLSPFPFSQVFLKEHSRGLYSSYTNYTVHSMPLYLLKIINAILFAVVSWGWMDVDNSTGTFI